MVSGVSAQYLRRSRWVCQLAKFLFAERERDGNTEVDNLLEGHDCTCAQMPSAALLFKILKMFELPFCPDIAETEHFLLVHPEYMDLPKGQDRVDKRNSQSFSYLSITAI